MPRAIALILLILAYLAYSLHGIDVITIGLLLAGAVLLLTPRAAAADAVNRFRDSWRLDTTVLMTGVIDALFWFCAILFMYAMQQLAAWQITALGAVSTDAAAIADAAVLEQNIAIVQQQALIQLSIAISLFLGLVVLYGVSRGLIWHLLRDARVSRRALLRYCLLTLCWWLVWLLPALVMLALSLSEGVALFALSVYAPLLGFAYWHFTGLVYSSFASHHRIGKAVTDAFAHGIGSFGAFLPAYALAVIPFYVFASVIMTAAVWFYGAEAFSGMPGLVAGLLFAVFFFLWFRPYQASVAARVVKKR